MFPDSARLTPQRTAKASRRGHGQDDIRQPALLARHIPRERGHVPDCTVPLPRSQLGRSQGGRAVKGGSTQSQGIGHGSSRCCIGTSQQTRQSRHPVTRMERLTQSRSAHLYNLHGVQAHNTWVEEVTSLLFYVPIFIIDALYNAETEHLLQL